MASVTIPQFDMPFRFGRGGQPVVVQQDTQPEVRNCVEAILRTEQGTRYYVPIFGIPDPTFSKAPNSLEIEQAVIQNEPRAVTTFTNLEDTIELLTNVIEGKVSLQS